MLDKLVKQYVKDHPTSIPLDGEVVGFGEDGDPTLDEGAVIKIELAPSFASIECNDGSLIPVPEISLGQLRGWWDEDNNRFEWEEGFVCPYCGYTCPLDQLGSEPDCPKCGDN